MGKNTRGGTRKLPVFDDYGNLVAVPPNERTFERKQGCFNCRHYIIDDVFEKRVKECFDRDVKVFLDQGLGLDIAGKKAEVTRKTLLGFVPQKQKPRGGWSLLPRHRGLFGLCLKGKVDSDFTSAKHLCLDGWEGKQGVTGSFTPGEKYDEPVAALFDDLGEKPGGTPKSDPEPDDGGDK